MVIEELTKYALPWMNDFTTLLYLHIKTIIHSTYSSCQKHQDKTFISIIIFRIAFSIFHHSNYYVCTSFRIELTKICSVYMFKSVCVIKARLRKVKYQLIKNKQANSPSSFHSIYQSAFTFYLFLRTLSSTMKNTIVFMTLDISRIKCHQGRKQKFLAHQILFKSSNFYSNVKLPEIIVTPLLRHFLFELKQIFISS